VTVTPSAQRMTWRDVPDMRSSAQPADCADATPAASGNAAKRPAETAMEINPMIRNACPP
jgi:hypothetical protein